MDDFEVEGSLALGAGLLAASASSFSRALTFRVRESTWKLSFLRSLSTLIINSRQTTSEERKRCYLHQVLVIRPLYLGTFFLKIFLHLVASFLQLLKARLQIRFLAESVELVL